jgi:trimeric autotransporter adhesin
MWITRGFLFLPFALACFALSPAARAVSPAPDGGYPNGNTAEGTSALLSLTTGVANTAIGQGALQKNTTGNYNTANGFAALLKNTTGHENTANGLSALYSNTTGFDNTANGLNALYSNTNGYYNTANGYDALQNNTTGHENTANGLNALYSNTAGADNTANGLNALYSNTAGNSNTAEGYQALQNTTTASFNIALGYNAGKNLTTGSSNIDVGNAGVATDSNKIRIGKAGTHNATFIAGIRGVITANANAIPVLIDSAGQLGTTSSSRRFKKEIKPMDQTSEAILALKPVTFHYKSDSTGTSQFGLIAEEVAAVDPDLVVRDTDGEIYTVRYEAVNAMLLNEFLKQHRKVEEQGHKIQKQEATIAKQQKQIEALTTGLQKVSDQLELRKPAPQTVLNNP